MYDHSSATDSLLSTPMSEGPGVARSELSAVSVGDSEKVHNLLRTHTEISLEHVKCPLLCIAVSKGYGDIVGLLLRHGIQINAQSADGSTALISAADNGNLSVLALILNAGANMNIANRNGETALTRATRKGLSLCSRLLLSYGANPHPMPSDAHSLIVSPLHLARQMHQNVIEHDILSRTIAMDNAMLDVVTATLLDHLTLIEPGHLADTKTLSLFPLQLISTSELEPFVLYFKTPPGYDSRSKSNNKNQTSDEMILVYIVRAQLTDTSVSCWLNGPALQPLRLRFNGSRKCCGQIPLLSDHSGICVFSVTTAIKKGGLNTLCLEHSGSTKPRNRLFTTSRFQSMILIGAYRIKLDVHSLIQSTVKVGVGSSQPDNTLSQAPHF